MNELRLFSDVVLFLFNAAYRGHIHRTITMIVPIQPVE